MGANAVTSVYDYTAGQILTAQQVDNLNCGIPVFATTTTRDAAFGGTGEKVLAEGQFAYIEASNTTQYYDGASWVTVNASGLVCVKAETSFSATNTVTVDNVFSSSYSNYILQLAAYGTNGQDLIVQLRTGGVTATAANYNQQTLVANSTTISGARGAGAASVTVGTIGATSTNSFIETTFFGPQIAAATGIISKSNYNNSGTYAQPIQQYFSGNHSLATSYDGFILTMGGGFTISGSYAVYGYSKVV